MTSRIGRYSVYLIFPILTLACDGQFRSPYVDGQFRWPYVAKVEAAPVPIDIPAIPETIPGRTAPIVIPRSVERSVLADAELDAGATPGANLLIPSTDEIDHFPEDFAIGSLRVDSATDAYAFAKRFLADLANDKPVANRYADDGDARAEAARLVMRNLDGRLVPRLGSAKTIPGGSLAYLIRFIGKKSSVSGELYLIPGESGWRVDELALDEPTDNLTAEGEARFDPLKFNRFF